MTTFEEVNLYQNGEFEYFVKSTIDIYSFVKFSFKSVCMCMCVCVCVCVREGGQKLSVRVGYKKNCRVRMEVKEKLFERERVRDRDRN